MAKLKYVRMTEAEFKREHRALDKVLRSGTKAEREREARKQAREAKERA